MMRRAVPVLLACCSLIAAGCGGGDKSNDTTTKAGYIKKVNSIGTGLQKQLQSVGSELGTQSKPAAIATKLDEGAKALTQAADDLDAVKPPSDATSEHKSFVEGIRELATTFKDGAANARAGALGQLQQTFAKLAASPGIKKIQAATVALRKKGYDVSGS